VLFAVSCAAPAPRLVDGDASLPIDAGVEDGGGAQDASSDLADAGAPVPDTDATAPGDTGVSPRLDTDSGTLDTDASPGRDGDSGPSLSPNICSIYESGIFANCANGYCHGSGVGGFQLMHDSAQGLYESLVDVETSARLYYVVPENVSMSYLFNKLEGTQAEVVLGAGDRMPPGGPYVDDDQLRVLRQWIETGASSVCP